MPDLPVSYENKPPDLVILGFAISWAGFVNAHAIVLCSTVDLCFV